jgi:ATP-dependent protease HslVU (ClpYQ) peptidase subunit
MSLNEFSSPFISIGSGSPFAMGHLSATAITKSSPESRVEAAVKTAIKFSPTCSGTVDVLNT